MQTGQTLGERVKMLEAGGRVKDAEITRLHEEVKRLCADLVAERGERRWAENDAAAVRIAADELESDKRTLREALDDMINAFGIDESNGAVSARSIRHLTKALAKAKAAMSGTAL